MRTSVIQRIAKAYGLEPSHIASVQKGYRNESYALDNTYNLILYKREPHITDRIKRANLTANYAATSGLPARKTEHQNIITLTHGEFIKYGALYGYLPGATIPWEAYTQTHIKLLGLGLSTLHSKLQTMSQTNLPSVEDEQLEILSHMEHYFADAGVRKALAGAQGLEPPAQKLKTLRSLMVATQSLTDRQPLHMDFVRGNILFASAYKQDALQLDGLAISGILDFEKVAYGPRWYDIARTYAFLLVDCKYKTAAQVRKYFLHSGYHKRGPIKLPLQHALLEPLVDFFLIHDFYKFLRHNPYEFLNQNEHYVRTRNIMKDRGLL